MNRYSIIAAELYRLAKILFASDVTRFIWNKKIFWINESQEEESLKDVNAALSNSYNLFFRAFNKLLVSNKFKVSKGTFADRGFKGNSVTYKDEAGVEIKLNTISFHHTQIIVSIEIEDKKFIFTDLRKVRQGYDKNEISTADMLDEYQKKLKKFSEEFKKNMNEYMDIINSKIMEGYEDIYDDSIEDREKYSDLDEDYSDEI